MNNIIHVKIYFKRLINDNHPWKNIFVYYLKLFIIHLNYLLNYLLHLYN